MRKKGHTKAKMKEIDPQKFFCSANIKKVPRAYESLNPALVLLQIKLAILGTVELGYNEELGTGHFCSL
jgi:hypothetical protein